MGMMGPRDGAEPPPRACYATSTRVGCVCHEFFRFGIRMSGYHGPPPQPPSDPHPDAWPLHGKPGVDWRDPGARGGRPVTSGRPRDAVIVDRSYGDVAARCCTAAYRTVDADGYVVHVAEALGPEAA